MSEKKEEGCPYELLLTAEEEDALNWLQHFLQEKAQGRGPQSRIAHIAHTAVGKVFSKGEELHDHAHRLEVELLEAVVVGAIDAAVGAPVDKKDLH